MHWEGRCQQAEGADPAPLLGPAEASLECCVQFWQEERGASGVAPVSAVEMLKGLVHLSFQERLSELCLFSLERRHS